MNLLKYNLIMLLKDIDDKQIEIGNSFNFNSVLTLNLLFLILNIMTMNFFVIRFRWFI